MISEIKRLKKEKNAVIMAHYYQNDDIQDIADFIGDSLALARQAAKTDAGIIIICGVKFMGETAKIICPDKKVLIPDINAGCSLADSCEAKEFEEFIKSHSGYKVVTYVNTSAEVKALTDIVVTSTNAVDIIESFPKDQKIIFGPDRNLGNYINKKTGRNMLLWNGSCKVHERFSYDDILRLKKEYPDAEVLSHPECKESIVNLSDYTGSTAGIINYASKSDKNIFIIATESGVLHEMQKKNPGKTFIPVSPENKNNKCNECADMRLITMEKLYNCINEEYPSIELSYDLIKKAIKPVNAMLDLSEKLHL